MSDTTDTGTGGSPTGDETPADAGTKRLQEWLWPAMEAIEARSRNGQDVAGLPTGYRDLDELTSGLQPGQLVALGGRPGSGKTALALNIALHTAVTEQRPVAYLSLDTPAPALVQQMLCMEARIDYQALSKGRLREDDYPRLARAGGILSHAPLHLGTRPAFTTGAIARQARQLHNGAGLDLLIVDYLQMIRGSASAAYRPEVLSDAVRALKRLALELDVPVLLLSHVARRVDEYTGWERGRPTLNDLAAQAGSLADDADQVWFIRREELHADRESGYLKDPSVEGKAEVIVGKSRRGPVGSIPLFFHKRFTRFEGVARPAEPPTQ